MQDQCTHTQDNELRAMPSNSNPAKNSSQVLLHTQKMKEYGYIHIIAHKLKQRKVQLQLVEPPEPGIPSSSDQDPLGEHIDNNNIRMSHRTTN